MDLKSLQNLPYEKRLKIFYAVVGIFTVILFYFWTIDVLKRINGYSEKYKVEKTINSRIDYSQSLQKTKQIMDKVNKQMEQDMQKYDSELNALEQISSSVSTSSTSTANSTSTVPTSLPTGQVDSTPIISTTTINTQ